MPSHSSRDHTAFAHRSSAHASRAEIETRSSVLAAESKKYHQSAKKLASQLWWRTYGPFIGAGLLVLFFLFIRFYFY